eukprot:SAG22_NODE_765_length_7393_cov_5.670003_3_plen_320_part_00
MPVVFCFGQHFVVLSTEHSLAVNSTQYDWLVRDLAAADAPASRAARPWIVLAGHYPPVCSHEEVCGAASGKYTAAELDGPDGLLGMLAKYHVDVALWGHIHAYERTYPLVHQQLAATGESYHQPEGTAHFMIGMAGAGFSGGRWRYDQPSYSAFREDSYGYMRITVSGGGGGGGGGSRGALKLEYVRNDGGRVQDSVEIVKGGNATAAWRGGGGGGGGAAGAGPGRRLSGTAARPRQHSSLGHRGPAFGERKVAAGGEEEEEDEEAAQYGAGEMAAGGGSRAAGGGGDDARRAPASRDPDGGSPPVCPAYRPQYRMEFL